MKQVAANSELWNVIQAWIDSRPWPVSQRTLASKIGVNPAMLTYWKTGKGSPSAEVVEKIAEVTLIPKLVLLRAVMMDQGYLADPEELDRLLKQSG